MIGSRFGLLILIATARRAACARTRQTALVQTRMLFESFGDGLGELGIFGENHADKSLAPFAECIARCQ
jgi:hypothetical protein